MDGSTVNAIMDQENGLGFHDNVDTSRCYRFNKNGSFIIFRILVVEGVKIAHVRYLHWENEKDLTSIMAHACNFWMGNHVKLVIYREKDRGTSAMDYFDDLGFKIQRLSDYEWKHQFTCVEPGCQGQDRCACPVYEAWR